MSKITSMRVFNYEGRSELVLLRLYLVSDIGEKKQRRLIPPFHVLLHDTWLLITSFFARNSVSK